MRYDPEEHHRRSIRLRGYDYTQAVAYFVTMVAFRRAYIFGGIVDGEMQANIAGAVVLEEWLRSSEIRRELELDAFVVMPNHVHAIVIMRGVGAHGRAPLLPVSPDRPPRSLGSFVAGFKSAATKRINTIRGTPGLPVWQRNYYEHVVRDEDDLGRIRQYILENPPRWAEDPENPEVARAAGGHGWPPMRQGDHRGSPLRADGLR